MGSRSALLDVALPVVEIESFEVEPPRLSSRRQPRRMATTVTPPGRELIASLRHRYDVAIGAYRDFDPRLLSTVEHRVDLSADAVIAHLHLYRATFDPFEREHRVPFVLHLPWSWPALPMWLSVSETSPTMSALRLSLRSRRRLRYPKRYFHAAHAALRNLESDLLCTDG